MRSHNQGYLFGGSNVWRCSPAHDKKIRNLYEKLLLQDFKSQWSVCLRIAGLQFGARDGLVKSESSSLQSVFRTEDSKRDGVSPLEYNLRV